MIEMLTDAKMQDRPRDVPDIVAGQIGAQFVLLEKGGIVPVARGGREVVRFSGISIEGIDPSYAEDEKALTQLNAKGYTDGVDIRRNPDTGEVTYAEITGFHPRGVSRRKGTSGLFKADRWVARMEFPSTVPEDGNRRLVVDTWSLPYTKLGRIDADNPNGLAGDAYAQYLEIYADLFKRHNAQGVPAGARSFRHMVFGGVELPEQSPKGHENVPILLERLDERVTRELNYTALVDAEIAAEIEAERAA